MKRFFNKRNRKRSYKAYGYITLTIISSLILYLYGEIKQTEDTSQVKEMSDLEDNHFKLTSRQNTEDTLVLNANGPLPVRPPFDTRPLPNDLLEFVSSKFSEYRLPEVNDYPEYYFDGYSNDNNLPYYCSGHFNNDSILDHALLLLKDSTEQLVLSIHKLGADYRSYKLRQAPLVYDSQSKKWFVSHIIETEKEKVLEAIDTTYRITTDALTIADIEESRTRVMVWNMVANRYDDLVFD
ncbi:hypothetical protein [Carboxylicivirga sp. N1Y90]|uniref:hypothetical protein n=1 Tax=Carboxylicivirga fragile TaxID=3417571 RepID=UPI003D344BE3|nr:hypothetical protein [Marinilabiliaceae bacterium N1Y90]